jgi:hypothetical protein
VQRQLRYRFDPHKTLDRLEDLHSRVREAIDQHKAGRVGAAEAAATRTLGEARELFDKEKTLQDALRAIERTLAQELGSDYFYVVEWGIDYLIYEMETGQTFRREFRIKPTEDGFDVTLKSAAEVQQVWQGVDKKTQKKESANGAARLLEEAATEAVTPRLLEAGRATIKLIAPGQGSSGFYSERILQRDGPQAFPAGTHMYLDHPTVSEEFERPERSVKDIAAKLTSAPRYEAQGPSGPGLYAEAEVSDTYKQHLAQFKDVTGVSIRAMGEMDGDGNVTKLLPNAMNSVDFVTVPGAGGRIVELIESARQSPQVQKPEVKDMEETEVKRLIEEARAGDAEALRERDAKIARLEATILREAARTEAARILESIEGMHPKARAEVIRNVSQSPPVKEGALDHDAFGKIVDAETKRVAELFEAVGGTTAVIGNGEPKDTTTLEEANAELLAAYKEAGTPETTLEHLRRIN